MSTVSIGGPQGQLIRKERPYGYPGCLDHWRANWNRACGGAGFRAGRSPHRCCRSPRRSRPETGHRAALEPAHFGVRVNAVAPGPTETSMLNRFTGTPERKAALAAAVPLGRVAEPEEIARAIVFLASDKASFVTGQVLTADGGKTAG